MTISRAIPPALAGRPNWMGVEHGTKKPHSIRRGFNGEWKTPEAYADFPDILDCLERGEIERIGFVFRPDLGWICIDLDNVRDPETGEVAEWAQRIIDQFKGIAYIEISLSGTGFHIVFAGRKDDWMTGTTKTVGKSKIEFFDEKFVILTGDTIDGSVRDFGDGQEIFKQVYAEFFPKDVPGGGKSGDKAETGSVEPIEINAEIIESVIEILRSESPGFRQLFDDGDMSQSDNDDSRADQSVCSKVAWNTKGMSIGERRAIIDAVWRQSAHCRKRPDPEKLDRNDYRKRTIKKALSNDCLDGQSKKTYMRTDLGNSERMADQYRGDIVYCGPFKKWYVWDKTRYAEDRKGEITQIAKRVVRSMYSEASTIEDEDKRKALAKFAAKSEAVSRVDAMVKLCRSEVPVLPEQFDQHPMLLNCPNGTIDLMTGQLRPHRREDYLTKLCPTNYNPDAPSITWDQTLEKIFAYKQDFISFLQRVFGYCLTSDTSEQIILIPWGDGSNGKSTILTAIAEAVGFDYVMFAGPELLIVGKQQRHSTERMSLFGKRLVICSESEDGHRLSESFIKQTTGGERIRGRYCGGDDWEFDATHKYILQTNHRPVVRGNDHAVWRRIALLPFEVRFWNPDKNETGPDCLKQDKHLPKKLNAESEGILAWLVRGCLDWQAQGLNIPEPVIRATEDYQRDEDILGTFLKDRCVISSNAKVKAVDLYQEYKKWADQSGEYCAPQRRFGTQLSQKGFQRFTNNGTWYTGLGLIHGGIGT